LNKEVYVLKEGDDLNKVIVKLEQLKSDLMKFTVKTDFTGLANASFDFTHENLERMLLK